MSILEVENTKLKTEIESLKETVNSKSIKRLDTNNNSIIDAVDASIVLNIYVTNSSGGNISVFTKYYKSIIEN